MSEDMKSREPGEKADSESRRKLVVGALASAPLIVTYKARGDSHPPSGPHYCLDGTVQEETCSPQ